jgi:glycosyltransferase involved in cell wall biosynthesis
VARRKFSIVIPTYSGADTLGKTFESIVNQVAALNHVELVTVIDGPNKPIENITEEWKSRLIKKGIRVQVRKLPKNQGRFNARLIGAEMAKAPQLLFVDDRVRLEPDFISQILEIDYSLALPNVREEASSNIISRTLYLLRRKIYKGKWGESFDDYFIDRRSFEQSPKGTTSLWVPRELFIETCNKVKKDGLKTNRFLNEDTKLLKTIIDDGHKILRTSKLNIVYQPRGNFKKSVRHLYERGPRFVDYYARFDTRFFPLLLIIYALVILVVVTIIIQPYYLIYYLAAAAATVFTAAAFLAKSLKELFTGLIGLPLVFLIFAAGVMKGSLLKLVRL